MGYIGGVLQSNPAVLAPEDLVPALLAVLVGREGEQHQDGQHLDAGELAPSPAPAP